MNTEIRWQIEGEEALGGAVPFDAFCAFLDHLADSLRATEIDLVGASGPHAAYTVADLSCASPATVAVRPAPGSTTAGRATREFKRRLRVLYEGNLPAEASPAALRRYARLTTVYRGAVTALRLVDDEPLILPRDWSRRVRGLVAGVNHCVTTWRGVLEGLNMRTGSAGLEPLVGPARIACHVPPALRALARECLGEVVDVRGGAHTRAGDVWPYRFVVQAIAVLPPPVELPTAEQVIGSAPNLTNGRGALAYLRDLRDAEA